jgi:hypothetical protein
MGCASAREHTSAYLGGVRLMARLCTSILLVASARPALADEIAVEDASSAVRIKAIGACRARPLATGSRPANGQQPPLWRERFYLEAP